MKDINIDMLCMGCMREKENAEGPCPFCGFEEITEGPINYLPCRSILNGKYLVGKVLGEGGFGITYLGWDLNLDMKVAVKEYYPSGLVTRVSASSPEVVSYTGEKAEYYRTGKNKFVTEAKILAKFFSLPGIVSVKDFFQESNTSYIVMEYIEGVTLKDYLKKNGGRIMGDRVLKWMRPVIHSLEYVHQAGLIHRDISPDNIMITKDDDVKLLDFGAARDISPDGGKSLSVFLKPGYAPEEQYRTHGAQGPWTDVYALCATIYKCMTGVTPPEPLERMREDTLLKPSQLGAVITQWQEDAILKGLSIDSRDRYQSMEELESALYGEEADVEEKQTAAPVQEELLYKDTVPEKVEHRLEKGQKNVKKKKAIAASSALCMVLCIVLYIMLPASPDKEVSMYGNSLCNMINGGVIAKTPANTYIYRDCQWGGGINEADGIGNYAGRRIMDSGSDMTYFCTWEDFFYYMRLDECVYRSTVNGTNETKILENCGYNGFQIMDGNIYYIDQSGDLYLTGLEGDGKTKLAENAEYFDVRDGEVYYTREENHSYKLYKVKEGGKEKELLTELERKKFVVDEECIYAFKYTESQGCGIEKISFDGKERQDTGITLTPIGWDDGVFNITTDQIYYSNADDGGMLYKADKDGTQKQKVSSIVPKAIFIFESDNGDIKEEVLCLDRDYVWYDCHDSEPKLIFAQQ